MSSPQFTATGTLSIKTLTEQGHVNSEMNFIHNVQAVNEMDAIRKVRDYYNKKSSYYEEFVVNDINIFDFIF